MRKTKQLILASIVAIVCTVSGIQSIVLADEILQTAGITTDINQLELKLDELQSTNTYEFYKLYKSTIIQLSDPPETIYDYHSADDILIIQKLVEAEATAGNFEDKVHVADVIFNRIGSDSFGDTAFDVLTQERQFSAYYDGRFKKAEPNQETIDAVEYAFTFPDLTDGALYFYKRSDVSNMKTVRWFEGLEYLFTDDIGHSFYK